MNDLKLTSLTTFHLHSRILTITTMSIYNDFGLEAKENFGGILELDDGEREHCEASEPTEVLVSEIRKGDVLVARMTTGDGYARDNERPF